MGVPFLSDEGTTFSRKVQSDKTLSEMSSEKEFEQVEEDMEKFIKE